jgi:coenzyme F420-0:L-glutamate ligase/coenzyme F420-1:gamma-L-glutamate ligase
MDLIDYLKNRRSYKIPFEKTTVKRELIEECIKVSQWAPSAHNSQPWRYIILDDLDMRTKLINEMNAILRKDLENDGKSESFIDGKINSTRTQFLNAPVLILVCMDKAVLENYSNDERNENEFVLGVMSVASSITYLLISFQKYGLASCWYSAPLFTRKIVIDTLNLPNSFFPLAFITVGFPEIKEIKPPKRKFYEDILFYASNLVKNIK